MYFSNEQESRECDVLVVCCASRFQYIDFRPLILFGSSWSMLAVKILLPWIVKLLVMIWASLVFGYLQKCELCAFQTARSADFVYWVTKQMSEQWWRVNTAIVFFSNASHHERAMTLKSYWSECKSTKTAAQEKCVYGASKVCFFEIYLFLSFIYCLLSLCWSFQSFLYALLVTWSWNKVLLMHLHPYCSESCRRLKLPVVLDDILEGQISPRVFRPKLLGLELY